MRTAEYAVVFRLSHTSHGICSDVHYYSDSVKGIHQYSHRTAHYGVYELLPITLYRNLCMWNILGDEHFHIFGVFYVMKLRKINKKSVNHRAVYKAVDKIKFGTVSGKLTFAANKIIIGSYTEKAVKIAAVF